MNMIGQTVQPCQNNFDTIHWSCQSVKERDMCSPTWTGILVLNMGSYAGMDGGRISENSGKDKYRSGYCVIMDAAKLPYK